MSPKAALNIADAWDAGYLSAQVRSHVKIAKVIKQLEVLIEQAVRRGEYESLVIARQILRSLK